MRSEEKSWGVFVIAVSVLVSVFVIALGCVRSCGSSAAEDTSSVSNGFAVLDSFPSRGSRAIDNRPYGDGTDAAAGSLPQSPAATAPSSEGAEDVEAEFREQIAAQVDHAPARKYIGRCRLTVYNSTESSWGYATATGAKSQHLMTCAVDPKVIPYGSNVIVVDKDGEEWRFKAIDCGSFSGKWIDIFFDGSELGGIYWLDEVFGGEFAEVYVEAAG